MVRSIGIIPAAGIGSRWGGYPKFMLPCGDGEWLIDRTIRILPCEKVVIVVSEETSQIVKQHVSKFDFDKQVVTIRQAKPELFGAILTAMEHKAQRYYMAMPDTYMPNNAFDKMIRKDDLNIGTFFTNQPERFGVFRDGVVIDKVYGDPGVAWGCLAWSQKTNNLWLKEEPKNITDAINMVERKVLSKLAFYYDMANFSHYVEFIKAIV